ncbi:hypothetical protein ACNSOL_11925 (plasmid) [Aliarcobacter lanthieri]|uniref:hypothetical protein n=1 Tax=Aliarcobacter lanthieri TaxID=1355374 RepID=UPI003AADCACE
MSELFNPYEFGTDFSTKKRVDGWDPDSKNCVNPHLLITGMSGAGKTTLLKDIIDYLGNKRNKIVFVLDIHNGLEVENENYIKYSARNTKVGINPFEFDYNIEDGGPKIRAEILVSLFKKHFMPTAGIIQQNILKELFLDNYKYKGILDHDETTWPKSEIDDMSNDSSSGTSLPTMSDLEDIYTMIFNKLNVKGGILSENEHFKMELEYYRKKIDEAINQNMKKKYENLLLERTDDYENHKREYNNEEAEDSEYSWFIKYKIDYTKYNSRNVIATLNTIGVYIRNFSSMNIFNAKKPKFDKNINRLDLSGFTNAGRPDFALFFFDLFLQRVFSKCKIKGEYKDRAIQHKKRGAKTDVFVVIDESRVILPTGKEKDNPYHMTNKISAESRKYGFGLILGSQRINHYGDEILSNFNTKIILKTDSSDIKITNDKLKMINKDLIALTNKPGVAVIGTGSIYKAVNLDLFKQFVC